MSRGIDIVRPGTDLLGRRETNTGNYGGFRARHHFFVNDALGGFGDTVKTARRAYVSDLKQSMKAIEQLEEIRAAE